MSILIQKTLNERVTRAVHAALDGPNDATFSVRPAANPKFGDYQFDGAQKLARPQKTNPRDLAARIIEHLDVADLCEPPEIAGPGYINFRLATPFLEQALTSIPPAPEGTTADRLGMPSADPAEKIVIDMASPNLAKEMHVGHLRSTVIGDSVARVLTLLGHDVERVNHVGDWGTQFGMLVAHLRFVNPGVLDNPDDLSLSDLEQFYVEAKRHFDSDPAFAEEARGTVVRLQGGDADTLKLWRAFCNESLHHCHDILDRLGVQGLIDRGESFYNDQLDDTLDELRAAGIVEMSQGAACVFLDSYVTRDGDPLPMIVQKSDGGFGYAATDLTAARHRIRVTRADRVLYFVGQEQTQHLAMLFDALRKAEWLDAHHQFIHADFGVMKGEDGKKFSTREGGTIKLKQLLEEAVARARAVIDDDTRGEDARPFTDAEKDEIARVIGIGAVKYADLSHNRSTDYIFSWDKMLSLEGNTAPYMLYAYARIQSIGRKAGVIYQDLPAHAPVTLEHESENALGKALLRFPDIVHQVARDLRPNLLTEYLYDVSKAFSRFYDRRQGVRVIDAEPEATRISRLRLCDLTARVLQTGLSLLGIETITEM